MKIEIPLTGFDSFASGHVIRMIEIAQPRTTIVDRKDLANIRGATFAINLLQIFNHDPIDLVRILIRNQTDGEFPDHATRNDRFRSRTAEGTFHA